MNVTLLLTDMINDEHINANICKYKVKKIMTMIFHYYKQTKESGVHVTEFMS